MTGRLDLEILASVSLMALLAGAGAALCACGQVAKTRTAVDAGQESGSSTADSGSDGSGGALPPGSASVLQHHMSPTRDGVYADPSMTKSLAATLTIDSTFAPPISGDVYAQPLYVTQGPGGDEAFIVATESNHVAAIDGSGAVIWDRAYGTPAALSNLPATCGNINPLGITGTPVIDMASRTIYFDAMTLPAGAGATDHPKHIVHAVSLDDGTEKAAGWPVDVDANVSGFNSFPQNQRGALALVNGVVYVPYGGHNGDCNTPPNSYHGWVVGIPVAAPTSVTAFSTGTIGQGSTAGGIWAVGGIASTTDGASLFVTTGNTEGASTWAGGEALLRLTAGPKFVDQSADEFYTAEWPMDDQTDQDLGAANPVVVDMPGAGSSTQHLVVVPGKDGYLYVLNRDNLGGVGGQLSRAAVAAQNVGGKGALNAASAAYTTNQGTYVAYHINSGPAGTGCPSGGGDRSIGVAKLTGTPPTPQVVWCSSENGLGSPMVTTTGTGDVIVWDANTHLYGYDGDTGATVYASAGAMASPMHYFNTPIDAGGRIVVATTAPGRLYVFKR